MKHKVKIVLCVCLALWQALAFAAAKKSSNDDDGDYYADGGSYPFIAINGGMAVSSPSGDSSFNDSGANYTFTADSIHQTVGTYGLAFGLENPFQWGGMDMGWQIGLSYQKYAPVSGTGISAQGFPGYEPDYLYNYKINASEWMIDNKVFFTTAGTLHPYAILGLGFAMKAAYDYRASPQDPADKVTLFNNKNSSSLVYRLGFGLDMDFSEHIRLGIGYRYSDLGKVLLGNAATDATVSVPITGTFSQAHLYNQSVQAELTVHF